MEHLAWLGSSTCKSPVECVHTCRPRKDDCSLWAQYSGCLKSLCVSALCCACAHLTLGLISDSFCTESEARSDYGLAVTVIL